ncbi:hypothetical protein THII_1587 [Thioploca ingrica]|uniref:Tox-GHH2 domain-containing protein n=1 Tax=Thioploca ingrica TaxID=40754 RepID=A0A090AFP7_9GAMM|nr:hypothetical protein THII_1587 [Thioploca ingrica]
MANNVFANGREIACKAAEGKSICSFPDVCWTPPQTAATPTGVPVPYPNTAYAKDTAKGTKNVKISNKEVMLRNKSYFKKSVGDQAGCAPNKGLVTRQEEGKSYFKSWSPNVKFEGKNVVRHFDLMTQNHGSEPGNTPLWPYCDSMVVQLGDPCVENMKKEYSACKEFTPHSPNGKDACAETAIAKECQQARKCVLVPYGGKGSPNCCPGQVAHHVIPQSAFIKNEENIPGWCGYNENEAPCICTEGHSYYDDKHGDLHTLYGVIAKEEKDEQGMWTQQRATQTGAKSITKVYPNSKCNPACLEAQLNKYHDKAKGNRDSSGNCKPDSSLNSPVRATHPMGADSTQTSKNRLFSREEALETMRSCR